MFLSSVNICLEIIRIIVLFFNIFWFKTNIILLVDQAENSKYHQFQILHLLKIGLIML